MPQFILAHGDAKSEGAFNELPPFVRGYIECIFFTEEASGVSSEEWREFEKAGADDMGGSFPGDCSTSDLAPDSLASILKECAAFQEKAAPFLAEAYKRGDYDAEQAGRDFWFTRNGHGVGFWDRKQLRATPQIVDPLCEIAHEFGESYATYGDDELIYVE